MQYRIIDSIAPRTTLIYIAPEAILSMAEFTKHVHVKVSKNLFTSYSQANSNQVALRRLGMGKVVNRGARALDAQLRA